MKVRIHTLWKVPVFCIAASWISFYITTYLGALFFMVRTVDGDGAVQVSADPVRAAVFHAVLFLGILLVGGFGVLRSMTKREIAVSAGIMASIYLLIALAQLYIPGFPPSLSVALAYVQNWKGTISSILLDLTDNLALSAILSSFAPLLFIPFGRKTDI